MFGIEVRLPLCPLHNIPMRPERPDVYLDHRRGDNKTLGSTIKGRPRGSKDKTAVAQANQADSIVKLNVPEYKAPATPVENFVNLDGEGTVL